MPLVKYTYSPRVRVNYLVLIATPPTCNIVTTKYAHVFYAEESDNTDDESDAGSSVSSSSTYRTGTNGVGYRIKDAVATRVWETMIRVYFSTCLLA